MKTLKTVITMLANALRRGDDGPWLEPHPGRHPGHLF
jgi:hypothetical protein